VVQITVDQLRPDYLDRFAPQLIGGFGRLMRQGVFFTNATHDHGTTETAPGHATLWSGRFPSHTGIVRNEIGVADPQMPLLFGRGLGASPFRFRGSAFFDWVRTREPASRALSVSRKDRGAILPLGRARQNVVLVLARRTIHDQPLLRRHRPDVGAEVQRHQLHGEVPRHRLEPAASRFRVC
jgi:hypothetical protein